MKYRVRVDKILEDGSVVNEVDVVDDPWFLRPILKSEMLRLARARPPVQNLPGQTSIEVGRAA